MQIYFNRNLGSYTLGYTLQLTAAKATVGTGLQVKTS